MATNETLISIKENIMYFNNTFTSIYTKLVIAVVILLTGFIIGRIVKKITYKILKDININDILDKKFNISLGMAELISTILSYIVYVATIFITLRYIGATKVIVGIISIFFIIIIFFSLLSALNDLLPNLFAGLFLRRKKRFKHGDRISFQNIKDAKILELDLLETKVKLNNGEIMFIPNSYFVKNTIRKQAFLKRS